MFSKSRTWVKPFSRQIHLAHAIDVILLKRAQLTREIQLNVKVKITIILRVRFHAENTKNFFVPFDRKIIIKVENSLLPVCVWSIRRSAESHPFMAFGELNGKECHQGMDVIIAAELLITIVDYFSFSFDLHQIMFLPEEKMES